MTKGAQIRDEIVFKTLQEELVGPCAYGNELDVFLIRVNYKYFGGIYERIFQKSVFHFHIRMNLSNAHYNSMSSI